MTTELTVDYLVIINALLRKNFKIFLMFRNNSVNNKLCKQNQNLFSKL